MTRGRSGDGARERRAGPGRRPGRRICALLLPGRVGGHPRHGEIVSRESTLGIRESGVTHGGPSGAPVSAGAPPPAPQPSHSGPGDGDGDGDGDGRGPARRAADLQGQSVLRRPGRLRAQPVPGAGRARPPRAGAGRAAVSGARPRCRAHPGPEPRPVPASPTPSAARAPASSATRSTCSKSRPCGPPGSPSRSPSRCAPRGYLAAHARPVRRRARQPVPRLRPTAAAAARLPAGGHRAPPDPGGPRPRTRRGHRAAGGSTLRRWYGFTAMQTRVARRLPEIITVSSSSAAQITEYLGVRPERISTIPIGTDVRRYPPRPGGPEGAGPDRDDLQRRLPAQGPAGADRGVRQGPRGAPARRTGRDRRAQARRRGRARGGALRRRQVGCVSSRPERGRADRALRSAEVACVPSLYEGFSLPAVEAMAVGLPLVSTTGGAIPEVAGPDGLTTLAVAARRRPGPGRRPDPAARRPGPARPARRGGPRARGGTLHLARAAAEATAERYRVADRAGPPGGGAARLRPPERHRPC